MTAVRRYEGSMYDSNRWDGFELRPGDIIIISTPPKCGTTWTQMICALLILQEPELPLPLDTLSPWIDMVTRARTDVFADLEAQTHRRFIKTHTPLDGIPNDPTVTYICVGRDPRDVGLSMDHHIDNTDIGAFLSQRERAAAIDGIEPGPLRPPRPRPDGERDRFWQWVDDETPSTQVGSSLRRTVEHLQTFRDAAGDLDVVYLHYDDLKADLEGQMRQLAARLGIDVDEHRWPRLVQAATFESMRSRAGTTVPAAAVRSTGSIPPRSSAAARAASGATSSTTPTSPGTPRACGPSRPATSSSGCIASRSTEIPVRRYTRTTQS
jgi:aryl sulfotransferase